MKYINGDLIAMAERGDFDVIVHGCNCFNTMGGGIARTVRNVFPEAYDVDCDTVRGDRNKLGTYTYVDIKIRNSSLLTVVNAYTQYRYYYAKGEDPTKPLVEYDAVRSVFSKIKKDYGGFGYEFGIPKIGAGLALGDWDTIEKIIDEEMAGENVTCVLFD